MSFIRNNLFAFILAIMVHAGFVAVLFVGLDWTKKPARIEAEVDIVQAVAVDESKVQAELNKLKKIEKRRRQREKNRQKKADKELRKTKKEREREEKRRKQEELRLAKVKKEKEQEAKQTQELTQIRKVEKERLTKLKKEQKLAEKKKIDAERAAAEAEMLRKMMEEAQVDQQTSQEGKRLDAEQKKHAQSEVAKHVTLIKQKVQRHWLQPKKFESGWFCTVAVTLIPGGDVIDAQLSKCNGDAVFERSVIAAVNKASPLPVSREPYVFNKMRNIEFEFNPKMRNIEFEFKP